MLMQRAHRRADPTNIHLGERRARLEYEEGARRGAEHRILHADDRDVEQRRAVASAVE